MKNSDVRGTCLAIIRNRISGASAARTPRPAALGLRLEHGDLAAEELANLCAGALGATGADAYWHPSETLQALLGEYHRIHPPMRAAAAPARPALVAVSA